MERWLPLSAIVITVFAQVCNWLRPVQTKRFPSNNARAPLSLRGSDACELDHRASDAAWSCIVKTQPIPVQPYQTPKVIGHDRNKPHCPIGKPPKLRATPSELHNLSVTGSRENSAVDNRDPVFWAFKVLQEAPPIV